MKDQGLSACEQYQYLHHRDSNHRQHDFTSTPEGYHVLIIIIVQEASLPEWPALVHLLKLLIPCQALLDQSSHQQKVILSSCLYNCDEKE